MSVLLSVSVGVTGPRLAAIDDHIRESQRLLSTGDLDGAEREAKLALADSADQNPVSQALAWTMLGTIRLKQNRGREAIEDLEKAIRLAPELVGARLNLGEAYVWLGEIEKARNSFREALKLRPDNATARLDLAQLEASAGNYAASLQVAEPSFSFFRAIPEGILTLAADYSGQGEKNSLAPLVADWKKLEGVSEAQSLEFASYLSKRELPKEALEVLQSQVRSDKSPSFELSFALAGLNLHLGDTAVASNYYTAALNLRDDCIPCLQGLASIAEKEGETEKALAYMIRARKLAPENPDVEFQFGRVCLKRDLLDDGIEALEKAVALRPADDHFVYVLASGYVSAAHYAKARPLLEQLLAKHPNDYVLHYAFGALLYLQGQFDAATTSLEKSIALEPEQVGAYYYLGLAAGKKRDYQAAKRTFEELLKRHPEHIPSYAELGTALVALRENTEAQAVLEKAIRLDPSSTQAHYQMAVLLDRLGKHEEAQKEATLAREREKQHRAETRSMRLCLDCSPD